MAMCVYKYVVIGWLGSGLGGSCVDIGVYISGAPCIGEGWGTTKVPSGSKAAPNGEGAEGSPPEAHRNKEFEELMIIMTT